MELEDTVETVKDEVNNYFNEANNPNEPPVDTPEYQRFMRLCSEIHEFVSSPAGEPTAYTSENVVGLHSWSRGTTSDGTPVGWQQIFKLRLNRYRKMFRGRDS